MQLARICLLSSSDRKKYDCLGVPLTVEGMYTTIGTEHESDSSSSEGRNANLNGVLQEQCIRLKIFATLGIPLVDAYYLAWQSGQRLNRVPHKRMGSMFPKFLSRYRKEALDLKLFMTLLPYADFQRSHDVIL